MSNPNEPLYHGFPAKKILAENAFEKELASFRKSQPEPEVAEKAYEPEPEVADFYEWETPEFALFDNLKSLMIDWQPIDTAPKTHRPFSMFVVIALNSADYTTEPCCVWRKSDGSFARWPYPFEPTHWLPLPDYYPS